MQGKHFILACTDQEFGGEKVRDSKWIGGSHEIRRISEYSGLVFFLVGRLVSRKIPNFAGLSTMYGGLSYSIAQDAARKQGYQYALAKRASKKRASSESG
jgi:hypothetical protein